MNLRGQCSPPLEIFPRSEGPASHSVFALLEFSHGTLVENERASASRIGEISGRMQSVMTFILQSTAFLEGGTIPPRYTCEGSNISPPLNWFGEPEGTKSFVLFVDDPDAPNPLAPEATWVHWVLYDIPADVPGIMEGQVPPGAKCGNNDWKRADYGGPCPPTGRHRYFHRLYAMDRFVANFRAPSKVELLRTMVGHVLGEAVLMGTYQKSSKRIVR